MKKVIMLAAVVAAWHHANQKQTKPQRLKQTV
jgi:hypothetical protein